MNKVVFQGRDIQRVTVALAEEKKDESRQQRLRRRQENDGLRQLNVVTSTDEQAREAVKAVADLLSRSPEFAADLLALFRSGEPERAVGAEADVPEVIKVAAARLGGDETRSDEEEVQALASILRERPDLRAHIRSSFHGSAPEEGRAGRVDERLEGLEHRIGELTSLVTSLVTELTISQEQLRSEPMVARNQPAPTADAVQVLADLAAGVQVGRETVNRALAVFPQELQPWLRLWVKGPALARVIVELAENKLTRRVLGHLHASLEVSEVLSCLSEALRELPQDKAKLVRRAVHALCDRPSLAHFTLASSRCDTTNKAIRIAMKNPEVALAGDRLHRLGAVRLGVIKTVAPEVFKATSPTMPDHLANDDAGRGPRQLG